MRIIKLISIAFLLAGCAGATPLVDNENNYDVIPINVQEGFLFFRSRTISLMNYALVQKKKIDSKSVITILNIGGPTLKKQGGVYKFRKDTESDYTVEVMGEASGLSVGSFYTWTNEWYLRFQKKGGVQYAAKVNASPSNPEDAEFTIYDASIGKIAFTKYYSRNYYINNGPEQWYGYVIKVNDSEYGILVCGGASSVYLRKGWQSVPHADMINMYLLSVYENYELMKRWKDEK